MGDGAKAWPTTSPDIGQAYRKRHGVKFILAGRGSFEHPSLALAAGVFRLLVVMLEAVDGIKEATSPLMAPPEASLQRRSPSPLTWAPIKPSSPRSRHGTGILEVDWAVDAVARV